MALHQNISHNLYKHKQAHHEFAQQLLHHIYHMYQDVLKIAKREKHPKEWYEYRELLEDIAEMEEKCKNLKEEMDSFKHRI